MENTIEFNNRILNATEELEYDELKQLYTDFVLLGICEKVPETTDRKKLIQLVKNGLSQISIEDLNQIAPKRIKNITSPWLLSLSEIPLVEPVEPNESEELPKTVETSEILMKEARNLLSDRDGGKRPRNPKRLEEIFAKLHFFHKVPNSTIAEKVTMHRRIVGEYVDTYREKFPDIVDSWMEGIEHVPEKEKPPSEQTLPLLKTNVPVSIPSNDPSIVKPEGKPEGNPPNKMNSSKPTQDTDVNIGVGEMVLHETPRMLIRTVAFMEGLQNIKLENRHMLEFARLEISPDGTVKKIDSYGEKAKGETLLSLADIAIFKLTDIYSKYKRLEPDVIAMKEKIIGLSIANEWMACEIENLRNEKNMLMQSAFLVSLQRRR